MYTAARGEDKIMSLTSAGYKILNVWIYIWTIKLDSLKQVLLKNIVKIQLNFLDFNYFILESQKHHAKFYFHLRYNIDTNIRQNIK